MTMMIDIITRDISIASTACIPISVSLGICFCIRTHINISINTNLGIEMKESAVLMLALIRLASGCIVGLLVVFVSASTAILVLIGITTFTAIICTNSIALVVVFCMRIDASSNTALRTPFDITVHICICHHVTFNFATGIILDVFRILADLVVTIRFRSTSERIHISMDIAGRNRISIRTRQPSH